MSEQEEPSSETLIEMLRSRQEAEWQTLYRKCHDPSVARCLASQLEKQATPDDDIAAAWADVLTMLHPELKVQLRAKTPNRK